MFIVVGDINTKVGSTVVCGVTDAYGLGTRNDSGD